MAAGAQAQEGSGASRRRVPRFQVQAPLDVTVLRSGISDKVPGRSLNVSESGFAAVVAKELAPGETVGVEVRLPMAADPLRVRALVKYQDKLQCGMEFVGLSAEQRAAIRDWTKEAKAETGTTVSSMPVPAPEAKSADAGGRKEAKPEPAGGAKTNEPSKKRRVGPGTAILVLFLFWFAIALGIFWWRWNREWHNLEAGMDGDGTGVVEKPQAKVSAEVMERLVIHRVEPVYPAEARQQNLEGIIALDIVVGRDGSVVRMHALNGPDVLARAAMDALRWWKFEPYRVNGEPAVVETTVAVEFRR